MVTLKNYHHEHFFCHFLGLFIDIILDAASFTTIDCYWPSFTISTVAIINEHELPSI